MAVKEAGQRNIKDREFSRCGVTTNAKGETKIKWGDADNTAILASQGHTGIVFAQLGSHMNKLDAVKHVRSLVDFEQHASLLDEYITKAEEKTQPKVKKTKQPEETITEVKGFEMIGLNLTIATDQKSASIAESV